MYNLVLMNSEGGKNVKHKEMFNKEMKANKFTLYLGILFTYIYLHTEIPFRAF